MQAAQKRLGLGGWEDRRQAAISHALGITGRML